MGFKVRLPFNVLRGDAPLAYPNFFSSVLKTKMLIPRYSWIVKIGKTLQVEEFIENKSFHLCHDQNQVNNYQYAIKDLDIPETWRYLLVQIFWNIKSFSLMKDSSLTVWFGQEIQCSVVPKTEVREQILGKIFMWSAWERLSTLKYDNILGIPNFEHYFAGSKVSGKFPDAVMDVMNFVHEVV